MGNINKTMKDNLKQNQEFMIETQRIQLERQIHMQNEMREKMMAMQVARARELLYWLGAFYAISSIGMIAGCTKKANIFIPLLPLTFIVGYQADMAYGSKLNRIKMEAENIISFERDSIALPYGIPTVSSIDESRQRQEESKRLNKALHEHRSGYY